MRRSHPEQDLLLRVLISPTAMVELSEPEWDALLPRARASRLLARLAAQEPMPDWTDRLPWRVRDQLTGAAVMAAHNERLVRWEVNRIERALKHLALPILLLKGAAYLAAGLAAAKGRLVSDVDIMVPHETLEVAEAALRDAGWQPIKLDPYHQRYYRSWMHELPPLRHQERGTVVDLHHTILPPTSRLKPDPAKLWAAARRLDRSPLHVLAPADMVLHAAAHLFQDGDLRRALRDLVDIGDLLGHFGAEPGFWRHLVPRAAELGLGRPLFYALRYCRRLLRTPIPDDVMAEAPAPPRPVLLAMDRLVPRVLIPEDGQGVEASAGPSLLLYMRAHWLRMPPWLLLPHLARQAARRVAGDR
ncbi:MAG: nucleotidyltransferase domain-containing protein [Geminicoccaceae bacterium]